MTSRPQAEQTVAVIGGGASGLVAALALASGGLAVKLIAPSRAPDPRTTALMDGSVRALQTLALWDALRPNASPLRVMRLIDDTGRLLRAPEVEFRASELELDGFAWNLENETLLAALDEAVAGESRIQRIAASVRQVVEGPERARVELDDGASIDVALVAAADGRNSPSRRAAGIGMRVREYPQVAVTATLEP